MNKKILCIGDSFTFGAELPDPRTQSWAALLASNSNWEVTNLGMPGSSMDKCIRILFENIDDQYDLIVFGCPPWIRQETYLISRQQPIDIGVHKRFVCIPWEDDFYKYSYDDLFYYKKWLMDIIKVQSVLKQFNQKYIFHVTYALIIDEYKDGCKNLLDKLDMDYFLADSNTLYQLTEPFPKGLGNHPLEEGHRHIATLIQTKIDQQKLI